jgi:hypothetical protein
MPSQAVRRGRSAVPALISRTTRRAERRRTRRRRCGRTCWLGDRRIARIPPVRDEVGCRRPRRGNEVYQNGQAIAAPIVPAPLYGSKRAGTSGSQPSFVRWPPSAVLWPARFGGLGKMRTVGHGFLILATVSAVDS